MEWITAAPKQSRWRSWMGFAAWLTVAALQIDSVQSQFSDLSHHTCRPFPDVPLCFGRIGYNRTRWPNTLDENLPSVVNKRLDDMLPLVATRCHKWLFAFLCFIHVPHCSPGIEPITHLPITHVVGPCRQLCELVRDKCQPYIQAYKKNLTWPEHLYDCSQLISYPGQCFMPAEFNPNQTKIPTGFDLVPKIEVDLGEVHRTVTPTTTPPPRVCLGGSAASDRKWFRFGGQPYCGQSCRNDRMYAESSRERVMPTVVLTMSALAVAALLVCLASHLLDQKNFVSAEWGVLVITGCTLVAEVVQAIGASSKLAGHLQSCDGGRDVVYQGMGAVDRLPPVGCVLSFILTYFCRTLALFTWLKLAVFWLVTVVAARATAVSFEACCNAPATLIVWLLPAALTLAAFFLQKIDGGLLTGSCYVGHYSRNALLSFLVCPLAAVAIAVLFCLFVGWRVLLLHRHYAVMASPKSTGTATTTGDAASSSTSPTLPRASPTVATRRQRPGGEEALLNSERFERLGKFCFLLLVPAVLDTATLLYEYVEQDAWQVTVVACAADVRSPGCVGGSRPLLVVFGVRYASPLLTALVCLWYKNLLCRWLPRVNAARAVSKLRAPLCLAIGGGCGGDGDSDEPVPPQVFSETTLSSTANGGSVTVRRECASRFEADGGRSVSSSRHNRESMVSTDV